jgi:hypothetical protein
MKNYLRPNGYIIGFRFDCRHSLETNAQFRVIASLDSLTEIPRRVAFKWFLSAPGCFRQIARHSGKQCSIG